VATTVEGYSLGEAQAALTAWKSAVAGLATSQSYTIGQRTLTRVDLAEARKMVTFFASIVDSFAGCSGNRARSAVPRDL